MSIENKIDIIISNFEKLKSLSSEIEEIASICINTIQAGHKIMFCGNGGSASDAQHLTAELVVKYKKVRHAIPAISLTTDTSILTAIGNDIGAGEIFAREVEALGKSGDLLIGISTSGNSENIIKAVETAKKNNIKTIALTGKDGGKIKNLADKTLRVPSDVTNNIQEMHIAVGHMICEIIENELCAKD